MTETTFADSRYRDILDLLGLKGLGCGQEEAALVVPKSPFPGWLSRVPILSEGLTYLEPNSVGLHESPFDPTAAVERSAPQMVILSLPKPLKTGRLTRSLASKRLLSENTPYRRILALIEGMALGDKNELFFRLGLVWGSSTDTVPNTPGSQTALCGVNPLSWSHYPAVAWATSRIDKAVSGDNGDVVTDRAHPLLQGAPSRIVFHDDMVESCWPDETVYSAFWDFPLDPSRPERLKDLWRMDVDFLVSFWNTGYGIYFSALLRGRRHDPRDLKALERAMVAFRVARIRRETPPGFGWSLPDAFRAFFPGTAFPLTNWTSTRNYEWAPMMKAVTNEVSAARIGGPVYLGTIADDCEAGLKGYPFCFDPGYQPAICIVGPTRIGKTTWAISRAAQISQGFGVILMSWNDEDKSQKIVRDLGGRVLTGGDWKITEPESVAELEKLIEADKAVIGRALRQQIELWKEGKLLPVCLCPTENPGARFFAAADNFLNGFLAAWEEFNQWRKKREENPLWTALLLDDLGAVASGAEDFVLGKWPKILADQLWKSISTAVDTGVGKKYVCLMSIVHTRKVFGKQKESAGLEETHNLEVELVPAKTKAERHLLARIYNPKQRKAEAPEEGLIAVIRILHPLELTQLLYGDDERTEGDGDTED